MNTITNTVILPNLPEDLTQFSECIVVGDIYHWVLDSNGYFVIEENSYSRQTENPMGSDDSESDDNDLTDKNKGKDFFVFNIDRISENLGDN